MPKLIAVVTGATGIIGRRIVKTLLKNDIHVRVLLYGKESNLIGAENFLGSLSDIEVLNTILEGADYLFHCAAELISKKRMYEVNVTGTQNLYNVAVSKNLKYFCFISSVGVIGKSRLKVVDENTPCNPQNEYERTKYESELIVKKKLAGCTTAILRPTNVIDKSKQNGLLVPNRNSILDKIKILIKGNESSHLLHAEQVAECAIYLMNMEFKKPEVFILSNDNNSDISFRAIWNLYCDITEIQKKKVKFAFPAIIPYLLRFLKNRKINMGNIKYVSRNLNKVGYINKWSMKQVIEQIIIK